MNIRQVANFTRLDRMKLRLVRLKLWFVANLFIIMPGYTWLFFVHFYPQIQATQNSSLDAWYQFWTWILVVAHLVYSVFVFISINDLRQRIAGIEYDIDSKLR